MCNDKRGIDSVGVGHNNCRYRFKYIPNTQVILILRDFTGNYLHWEWWGFLSRHIIVPFHPRHSWIWVQNTEKSSTHMPLEAMPPTIVWLVRMKVEALPWVRFPQPRCSACHRRQHQMPTRHHRCLQAIICAPKMYFRWLFRLHVLQFRLINLSKNMVCMLLAPGQYLTSTWLEPGFSKVFLDYSGKLWWFKALISCKSGNCTIGIELTKSAAVLKQ